MSWWFSAIPMYFIKSIVGSILLIFVVSTHRRHNAWCSFPIFNFPVRVCFTFVSFQFSNNSIHFAGSFFHFQRHSHSRLPGCLIFHFHWKRFHYFIPLYNKVILFFPNFTCLIVQFFVWYCIRMWVFKLWQFSLECASSICIRWQDGKGYITFTSIHVYQYYG